MKQKTLKCRGWIGKSFVLKLTHSWPWVVVFRRKSRQQNLHVCDPLPCGFWHMCGHGGVLLQHLGYCEATSQSLGSPEQSSRNKQRWWAMSSFQFRYFEQVLSHFIVPTIENGEEICVRLCFFSSFCFPRKISYHKLSWDRVEWYISLKHFQSWFEPHLKKSQKIVSVSRKTGLNFFCLNLRQWSKRAVFFVFPRKISQHKYALDWVEWYIILKPFQSWFEKHQKVCR